MAETIEVRRIDLRRVVTKLHAFAEKYGLSEDGQPAAPDWNKGYSAPASATRLDHDDLVAMDRLDALLAETEK